MRKIVWLVLVAAFAVAPATAATKKQAKPMDAAAAQRDASWRFVKDGSPLVLPTWAQVLYFGVYKKDDKKK
jgi:hypothetical protein